MGQIVRDLGMTLLVGLVIHALYAARHTRGGPPPPPMAERIYATASVPAVSVAEQPPAGFSVFPWAP